MATIRWKGAATPIAQTSTVTITGTWVQGETITLTINGNDLVYTAGTTVTTSAIALGLEESINAVNATVNLAAGEVRNVGGQQIAELKEVEALVAANVVTITTKSAYTGKPFTISVADSAASGTAAYAVTRAAQSPNHLSVADNWDGGLPTTPGDTISFDSGDIPVYWDLDYLFTNSRDMNVIITSDYTGMIGLPVYDQDGGYPQYRARYMQLYCGATPRSVLFTPGALGLTNHADIRLYLRNAGGAYSLLSSTVTRGNQNNKPNVFIHGGQITDVYIDKGRFEFDPYDCASLGGNLEVLTTFSIGSHQSPDTPYVVVKNTADFDNTENMRFTSGTTIIEGSTNYTGGGTPIFEVHSGIVRLTGINPSLRDMIVDGGTLYPDQLTTSSSKITVRRDGTVDFSRSSRTRGHSSIVLYSGATLIDGEGLGTSVINLINCGLDDVTVQIPSNKKLTLSGATI